MLAAAHARNDHPPTRWVCGGVGSWLGLLPLVNTVKPPPHLLGLLVAVLCTHALAASELPGFLTPKKTLASHGGTVFELRMEARKDDNGAAIPITKAQLKQTLAVLDKRLKSSDIRDALLTENGDDGLLVKVPGVDADAAKPVRNLLEKTARLVLREVFTRNDETGPDGKSLAERVAANKEIVPGYKVFSHKHKDGDGNEITTPILLNKRTAIGSWDIEQAMASPQQAEAVAITLNREGANKLIALTKDMVAGRDRIAIVLDDEVISAPVVRSTPLGKQFVIEGLREPGEVQTLVAALMYPLEFRVAIETQRNIPPPTALK